MPEEKTEVPVMDPAELDSLKKANASKDQVITGLQEGKAVPKWLQDAAGVSSREDLLAKLSRTGEPQPDPDPKGEQKPVAFDAKKYADEDGVVTADGLAAFFQDMDGHVGKRTEEALAEAKRSDAIAAEAAYITEAAKASPGSLIPEEGDIEIVEAALDGLTARTVKDGAATQKQVLEARERILAWAGRVTDAENTRRAAEAAAAAQKEPPAGSPGSGDGSPTQPKPDESGKTPTQLFEQKREESRKGFQERRTA